MPGAGIGCVSAALFSPTILMVIAAAVTIVAATPAQAQFATRTWVSGLGNDLQPCSRLAPCQTFNGALSKTATGGEIDCLDPGDFGSVTITKPVTILCGIAATGGVLASGTGNGIVVNLATVGTVVLDGLDLEGVGTGTDGLSVQSAGTVIIRNSSIRNFSNFGINVAGGGGTETLVAIENCFITANGSSNPNSNPPVIGGGVNVQPGGTGANSVKVLNTLIDGNVGSGVSVTGPGIVVIGGSIIADQSPSLAIVNNGTVISYGNNVIRPTVAPTQTLPLQ